MIRSGIASILLVCLLMPVALAADSQESALQRSYERYARYLSTSSSDPRQINLAAFSLALAETQTTDLETRQSVFQRATSMVEELLLSDTSYYWTDQWVPDMRTTYYHDASDRDTAEITEGYTSAWANVGRVLLSYDASSRLDTLLDQIWSTGSWMNSSRALFSNYNASGMPGQIVSQSWDNSAWENVHRMTHTYASGLLVNSLSELWNGSAWANFSRDTFTYVNGNLTEYLTQSWQGGAWVNQTRMTSTWQSGLKTQSVNQSWQTGSWVNSSKYDYHYDGSNRLVLDTFSVWFSVFWQPYTKDSMIYTGDLLTQQLVFDLLVGNETRISNSYTGAGNLSEQVSETYSPFTMQWVPNYRNVYVYSGSSGSNCEGTTGNVNMIGIVDLSDLSLLIAYLTNPPQSKPDLPSLGEANVNGISIIDLSDLALLVAYLTNPVQSKPTLPNCPA